jgi:hypothetical protein
LTDQLFFGRGGLDLLGLEDHDWILDVVVTGGEIILANSACCAYLNGIGLQCTANENLNCLIDEQHGLPMPMKESRYLHGRGVTYPFFASEFVRYA